MEEHSAVTIGSNAELCTCLITDEGIQDIHARVTKEGKDYFVEKSTEAGPTYVNGVDLPIGSKMKLRPGDTLDIGKSSSSISFKVKLRHVSERTSKEGVLGLVTAA